MIIAKLFHNNNNNNNNNSNDNNNNNDNNSNKLPKAANSGWIKKFGTFK